MQTKISPQNWNYATYKTQKLKAFISYGAEPTPRPENIKELFYVNLIEGGRDDGQELMQKSFSKLSRACEFINNHYGDWEFEDESQKSQGSGCSSCSAH